MIRHVSSVIASIAVVFVTTFGTVLPAFAAISSPTNLTLVGGIYTNDTTPTFTWNRPAHATWYEFILDNGDWQSIGNVGAHTLWTLPNGWHTFYLRAHDSAGNTSVSTSLTFEIDTQGPSISAVRPITAKTGVGTRFSVQTHGESAAKYCALYVDGVDVGGMTNVSNEFQKTYTFNTTGSHDVFARCIDGDKNTSSGPVTRVSVTKGSVACYDYCDEYPHVARGTLVKTECDSYAPKSDSCHSVYYYGEDGKRHAFTSEAVYRSWYGTSYAEVVTISVWQMNAMSMGENVTMRPGTSLVKFMGSSTVYAVEKGGVLRPIVNEAVAKAIYGSRWVTYIVELPGSVKNDYSIGKKIDSSSDYSKSRAYYSVTSIDDNF